MKRSIQTLLLVCATAVVCAAQRPHSSHPYHPPAPPAPRRPAASERKSPPPAARPVSVPVRAPGKVR